MRKEDLKKRDGKISGAVVRIAAAAISTLALLVLCVAFRSVGENVGIMSMMIGGDAGNNIPVFKFTGGTETLPQSTLTTSPIESQTTKASAASSTRAEDQSVKPTKTIEENKYVTPADIALLIEEAEKASANAVKRGNIVETQYVGGSPFYGYKDLWVQNSTDEQLDLEHLYTLKPDLAIDKNAPSVLIYHTHTSESYADLDNGWYSTSYSSRDTNRGRNMVRVGDAICESLEEAGINVIHDTVIHDTSYNDAYSHSRAQVELYLELYPTIAVTIDVHRDAIENADGTIIKPVSEIDGKKAAQIMIIAGRNGGGIIHYTGWENNLRFAVQLQNKVNEMYPTLMRPIFHCYRKYNMDMTPNSLLIEVGTHGNTLDEAVYSGYLFGKALGEMLGEYVT